MGCVAEVAEPHASPCHQPVGPVLRCVRLWALSCPFAHIHACCHACGASSVVWLSKYPVAHEASPQVYFGSLDKGEGVGNPGEGRVVWSELVVEEEMIFNCVNEFLGSGSFSCEGEGGNS